MKRTWPGREDTFIAQHYGAESLASAEEQFPHAERACDITADAPVPWLEYGEVPAGEITLIGGDPGSGKTGYTLKLAAKKAAEGLVVLVVSGEDPGPVLQNRLTAIAVGHRWDVAAVLGNIHVLALAGVQLIETRWQLHLLAEVERVGAGLVIFDPLFDLSGTDEDKNIAQRPVINFCRLLIRQTGATVIMVHHFGKAGEGKRKVDRLRGATAWLGAARAVYAVEARDDGVAIECLKLSRAPRPPTYVLERAVVTDPANVGTWVSATFHRRALRAADLDLAETWILEQLALAGAPLTTTELRKLALGTGSSREDLGVALHRLEGAGPNHLRSGPTGGEALADFDLAATLPGKVGRARPDLAPPLGGQARSERSEPAAS